MISYKQESKQVIRSYRRTRSRRKKNSLSRFSCEPELADVMIDHLGGVSSAVLIEVPIGIVEKGFAEQEDNWPNDYSQDNGTIRRLGSISSGPSGDRADCGQEGVVAGPSQPQSQW